MSLTHRERLKACIDNDPALDRPPVALWRHFPVDDQSPEGLAAATLTYQNAYDFDFVKVTPASSFCLRDWGVEDKWEGDPEGTRTYTKYVVDKPQDWEKLPFLNPSSPHLARQLTCLRSLKKALGANTPLIQTIFSPLAQAKNLAGRDNLLVHLRQYPEAVLKGLSIITESTRRFIEAAIDTTDIDGIFYAVQHAQAHILTTDEFSKFSKPSDLMLLKFVTQLPFNIVHLHGTNVFFDAVARYPVEILNWHDRETEWSLDGARKHYSRLGTGSLSPAFCGGLSTDTLVYGTPTKVRSEAVDAFEQTGQRRFILGTGCVTPIIAPHGNLMAARRAVEQR